MDGSPLIAHIKPSIHQFIIGEGRVSDFNTTSKQWTISTLNKILSNEIINKIKEDLYPHKHQK